jgi:hypothetical protein
MSRRIQYVIRLSTAQDLYLSQETVNGIPVWSTRQDAARFHLRDANVIVATFGGVLEADLNG